jgi:starch-binding outer membrane protein, SusD/RagB family
MKRYYSLMILALLVLGFGCKKDDEFLNKEPKNILLEEATWKDKTLIVSVLADLYDRIPDYQGLLGGQWQRFGDFNEALISNNGDNWRFQNQDWAYGEWSSWDYGFIRELNLFIQQAEKATELEEVDRKRFFAEGRFLRALMYFDHVKRMGGVPLILEPMTYDFSGDPTYLQHPRAKESEIYDFLISEMEAIKGDLPNTPGTKSRATKAAALALEARAALYAGSIAKYGSSKTPEVTLPGGEVGIPASKAQGYYQTALKAAQEIITGGGYSLYKKKENLSDNFSSLFLDKANNPEVIFAEDYKLKSKMHDFTVDNQPYSMTEESFGGRTNPSLNFVQSFELLNNTFAPIANVSGTDYIFYDNPQDIFAGRDARLAGTVILPGSSFRNRPVDIWGGFMLADKSIVTGTRVNEQKTLPGKSAPEVIVGRDGPIAGQEFTAQTGFYIRKYLDPTIGAGSLGTKSEVWWIRYRYAEVLLNAAEAAFELDQKNVAVGYLNEVRDRAGLKTPLTEGELSFDRFVQERRVELAFEDHMLWDMKRWRLAGAVWNGSQMTEADLKANIGKADKPNTQVFGLIPYKYYAPGDPNNGKWVFKVAKPNAVTNPDRFRLGNYYSYIADNIIANNPKLVRNPNQ